jgi:hypothetical protein
MYFILLFSSRGQSLLQKQFRRTKNLRSTNYIRPFPLLYPGDSYLIVETVKQGCRMSLASDHNIYCGYIYGMINGFTTQHVFSADYCCATSQPVLVANVTTFPAT